MNIISKVLNVFKKSEEKNFPPINYEVLEKSVQKWLVDTCANCITPEKSNNLSDEEKDMFLKRAMIYNFELSFLLLYLAVKTYVADHKQSPISAINLFFKLGCPAFKLDWSLNIPKETLVQVMENRQDLYDSIVNDGIKTLNVCFNNLCEREIEVQKPLITLSFEHLPLNAGVSPFNGTIERVFKDNNGKKICVAVEVLINKMIEEGKV